MSRFSRYDSDEERLPEGMTRVGYDADEEVYTFQDADGSLWESAPGNRYGRLRKVSDGPDPDDGDATQPFLGSGENYERPSWRAEMISLLNFGVLIGLALVLLFWYLHSAAPSNEAEVAPEVTCPLDHVAYTIHDGDTCWKIASSKDIKLDAILEANDGLDCQNLSVGSDICLPQAPAGA